MNVARRRPRPDEVGRPDKADVREARDWSQLCRAQICARIVVVARVRRDNDEAKRVEAERLAPRRNHPSEGAGVELGLPNVALTLK